MNSSIHFNCRVKNRLGISKKKGNKILKKAICQGIDIKYTKCRPSLYKYLNKLLVSDEDTVIVYNHHIIVYSKSSNIGITILELDKKFYSTIKSLKKEVLINGC